MISINGSAARRASVGDLVIIASFAQVAEQEQASFRPKLVFVDAQNRQQAARDHVPVEQA